MRVLVTGSRDWTEPSVIFDALVGETATMIDVIVHGACPTGADAMADYWAKIYGFRVERHPADWEKFGKAAGFKRNAEMVALGADVCLAFIGPCRKANCREPQPHGSHGASHTADLAEKAGIRTVRYVGC